MVCWFTLGTVLPAVRLQVNPDLEYIRGECSRRRREDKNGGQDEIHVGNDFLNFPCLKILPLTTVLSIEHVSIYRDAILTRLGTRVGSIRNDFRNSDPAGCQSLSHFFRQRVMIRVARMHVFSSSTTFASCEKQHIDSMWLLLDKLIYTLSYLLDAALHR